MIESPVWTPIGSRFSMLQTITTLSARSRITSSSNSFQPSRDCSIRIWETGLASSPLLQIAANSSGLYAMPPPLPPRVKAGLMMRGKLPIAAPTASDSSRVEAIPDGHTCTPMRSMACLNSRRSSAFWIALRSAPISSTPKRSSVPFSAKVTARLRAVWPPMVGSRASGRSVSMTRVITSGVSGSM